MLETHRYVNIPVPNNEGRGKMNPIIRKTFGGLSKDYLFRQFFFAILMGALFMWVGWNGKDANLYQRIWLTAFTLVCTLLYPYSRYVYESVVGFIMGDNVFFANAFWMMAMKFFTMMVCFFFSYVIAPFGLIYLYYYHSKPR